MQKRKNSMHFSRSLVFPGGKLDAEDLLVSKDLITALKYTSLR